MNPFTFLNPMAQWQLHHLWSIPAGLALLGIALLIVKLTER